MNISFWKEKGNKYIIFILVGLLILVMCIPTGTKTTQLVQEEAEVTDGELEAKLEQVLSAMEGVGDVEVMITTEGGKESAFGVQSVGQKVCGVVVVAEGAGSATVNARISEAVKALFSIDVHKISIVKMRSQEEHK
ncbi:MAG: hypothetical protein IJA07_11670 [Agathobacter sp.]|nr:hypothetical protein [Agathobacter sp.]